MTDRIVVDARLLNVSGIGTYIEELLPRVIARWTEASFTVLGDVAALRVLLGDRVAIRQFDAPIYSAAEQLALPRLIGPATLFWAPHYNIPLLYRGRLAVTVHDVNHLVFPQSSVAKRFYARMLFTAVRRRARVVLGDSRFAANDLRERVGAPRELVVAPLGVNERWFAIPDRPSPYDEPFFLYVGNVKPHKNLPRLLAAFAQIAAHVQHRLVIVGRREGLRNSDESVGALAEALGDRVVFTGYLERSALEHHIATCDALVLPSLYEGFGLPALEALACGRAVSLSNAASLPEVGGPVADYFDPLDVGSIAASLRRLASRPADTTAVRQTRRAWARRFDWNDCAETTVAALRRAASGVSGRAE